jgi:acetyl esterase/lipase
MSVTLQTGSRVVEPSTPPLITEQWVQDEARQQARDSLNDCVTDHRMRIQLISTFVITSLLIAAPAFGNDGPPYEQKRDVVYGEVHGTGLLMDIFTPKGKPNGLAIVDVVSGAWYSDRNKIRDHTLAQLYTIFCGRGYVVFAARPGSKTRYTAAEMDRHVKVAIRYAKEHAAEFKIDPARLGLTGASAGGHLATLAALTPAQGKPDAKNPLDRHDTSVRAVGVFFPPTDFLEWENGKMVDLDVVAPLLFLNGAQGRSQDEIKEAARAVSPFRNVGRPTIPFLLIHGDADKVVPLAQSQKLVAAIKEAGGSAELIVKAGGGHPWLTLPEEVRTMADWFDKRLAGSAGSPPSAESSVKNR